MAVYNVNGERIDANGANGSFSTNPLYSDNTVISVAHKGLASVATGNTKPAFVGAHNAGFKYVETDIKPTTDDILVISHDAVDTTYAEWYAVDNNRMTLEEFLKLCKDLQLFPYLEFKSATNSVVDRTMELVEKYGMKECVTYISQQKTSLSRVVSANPKARVGVIGTNPSDASDLQTGYNLPFLDISYGLITDSIVNSCKSLGVPLEAFTLVQDAHYTGLNPYVTGVTVYSRKYEDVVGAQY